MKSQSIKGEKILLKSVANGDTAAFHTLFNYYKDPVYHVAMRMLHSQSRSEDLVQEVFLKIWINREKLSQLNSFAAWLNTITRNHIYNALRRQAFEELIVEKIELSHPSQTEGILEQMSFRELQDSLQKVISTLTPQQKKVFELSRMQGLKHDEIATQLNISSETVKKHISDALRIIRIHLARYRGLPRLGILLLLMYS